MRFAPHDDIFSARLLRKLKYPCQQTANTPENINLYCGSMNAKLKAVTAGHNFNELYMLVGTVFRILAITPDGGSPVIKACIPKKYVLNTGVKIACCTQTLTNTDSHLEV